MSQVTRQIFERRYQSRTVYKKPVRVFSIHPFIILSDSLQFAWTLIFFIDFVSRWYFLLWAGVANELFFCMLYLLHFTSGPICKYYTVMCTSRLRFCLFTPQLCEQKLPTNYQHFLSLIKPFSHIMSTCKFSKLISIHVLQELVERI